MDNKNILIYKDPMLSSICRKVEDNEFGESLDKFMTEMGITLFESKGVGLAAPQIGSKIRAIVVDTSYLSGKTKYGQSYKKIINPEILSKDPLEVKATEGCLSFPGLEVLVNRSTKIKLKYQDPFGKVFIEDFEGWAARALLHEIDHLNGITLYSKAPIYQKNKYSKMMRIKYGL